LQETRAACLKTDWSSSGLSSAVYHRRQGMGNGERISYPEVPQFPPWEVAGQAALVSAASAGSPESK